MAHSTPFDQLTGTLDVYIAPVGSTFPDVDDQPTAPWVYLGETDGEQSVKHEGALTYLRDNEHQGPRKAVRPEEGVIIAFTLVSLTLEKYARVLHDVANVVEDTVANPDTKTMPLERGFVPTEYALLFRGDALSPYGVWPGMYVIPRGVFDGEPQPTFAKDGRAGVECEFHALDDDTQVEGYELGWLNVQTAVAESGSCMLAGTPSPEIVATYNALEEGVFGFTIYDVRADAENAYLLYQLQSEGLDSGVIEIPYRSGGVLLTGGLTANASVQLTASASLAATGCAENATHVFIAGSNGLYIVEKATLTQVGACEYIDDPWFGAPYLQFVTLTDDGKYAIGGGSGFGFAVFDLDDLTSPVAAYYEGSYDCEYLYFDGQYLFVVDDNYSLAIFDLADPINPVLTFFSDSLFNGYRYYYGIDVRADVLALGEYAEGEERVKLFDVTGRAAATLLGTYVIPDFWEPRDVRLVGKYLVILAYDMSSRLFFVDVSDPGTPALTATLDLDTYTQDGGPNGYLTVVDDRYLIVSVQSDTFLAVIDCCGL